MRKKRKEILTKLSIFLAVLFTFLTLNFASGLITLNEPTSGSNHSGTIAILNCTTNNNASSITDAVNATFYFNDSGGDVNFENQLAIVLNTSAGQIDFSTTSVSVSALADLASYNFTCVMSNLSTASTSQESTTSAAVNVTIDNTNPSCVSSISRKLIEVLTSNTLTCNCTDAVEIPASTTRTLHKPGTSGTVNATSPSYTASGNDVNVIGAYVFACTGTDYTGNTGVASNKTFRADSDEDLPAIGLEGGEPGTGMNTTMLIIIGIAVVVIVIVIIVVSNDRR